MEPFSALAIGIGLVGSLESTCKVLEDITSRFTKNKSGNNFRDAVVALRSYHRQLVDIQNSLRSRRMHAQLNNISSSLNEIEGHLKTLEESIQDMDQYRTTFLSRWQSSGLCGLDI